MQYMEVFRIIYDSMCRLCYIIVDNTDNTDNMSV